MLARGELPPGRPHKDSAHRRADWPDDLCEIVYIDHYGNAMTGLRAIMLPDNAKLAVAGRVFERARTFSDRPRGAAFWYENSNGLVEIAVNQDALASASSISQLAIRPRLCPESENRVRHNFDLLRCAKQGTSTRNHSWVIRRFLTSSRNCMPELRQPEPDHPGY